MNDTDLISVGADVLRCEANSILSAISMLDDNFAKAVNVILNH